MSPDKRGIINFLKPTGMSSFSAVSCVKRILAGVKAGHTGTLDPLAAGVLVICLGRGTKIIPYLPEGKKEYIAEIKLGITTDTLDREGEIRSRNCNWRQISRAQIEEIISDYRGRIEQIPPMFSAVHHQGQRLYELAREGKTVEREPREVEIYDIELMGFNLPVLRLRISCSRGTYIRSLARDLGEELGTGAHLSFLLRTRSGPFSLNEAHTCEEIINNVEDNQYHFLTPVDAPLPFKKLNVTDRARKKAVHGATLEQSDINNSEQDFQPGDKVRIYTPDEEFISISEIRQSDRGEPEFKPLRVFYEFT